jgi:hypothetical protein
MSKRQSQSMMELGEYYTMRALMLDWNFNAQSASISAHSDV